LHICQQDPDLGCPSKQKTVRNSFFMKIWGFFGLVWFPCFTKKSIIHFVLQISQSGHSFLSTVKPAMSYRPTAFTLDADLILTGAKRQAHAKAGPAKKAQLLRQEDLARVILSVFPGDDSTGCSSPTEMRTAFRSLIEYRPGYHGHFSHSKERPTTQRTPGSGIRNGFFRDPGSRISDPGSQDFLRAF
jgi:hypothetical protein